MLRTQNMNSVDDLLRELLRSSLWDVAYHEAELRKGNVILQRHIDFIERAGFDIAALEKIESDADMLYEHSFTNVNELLAALLCSAKNKVEYAEQQLGDISHCLAIVKTLLARSAFAHIDHKAVQQQVDSEFAARNSREVTNEHSS